MSCPFRKSARDNKSDAAPQVTKLIEEHDELLTDCKTLMKQLAECRRLVIQGNDSKKSCTLEARYADECLKTQIRQKSFIVEKCGTKIGDFGLDLADRFRQCRVLNSEGHCIQSLKEFNFCAANQ